MSSSKDFTQDIQNDVSTGIIEVTEPKQQDPLEILEKGENNLNGYHIKMVSTFEYTLKKFLLTQPNQRYLLMKKIHSGYVRLFRSFFNEPEYVSVIGAYIARTGRPIIVCHKHPDYENNEALINGFNTIADQAQNRIPKNVGTDINQQIMNGMTAYMKADELRKDCIFLENVCHLSGIEISRILDAFQRCYTYKNITT